MGPICASPKVRDSRRSDARAAIAVLLAASCAAEPRAPDGRLARGGASVFVEPSGASAMLFGGPVSPLAYDYDAMAAGGGLGCMTEPAGNAFGRGVRLVTAGALVVTTPRARRFALPFDGDTGAHVAAAAAPLFAPGDRIEARSAGSGDAPPFAIAAAAPPPVALVEPAEGAVVDRGADLAIAWAPRDGYVDVIVETTARTFPCVFPARRGRGAVPRHLLASEPEGRATLRTAAVRVASVDTSGWHVALTVASARGSRAIVLR